MPSYSAIIWAAGCFNLADKLGGKSVLSHSIDPFDEDDACLEVLLLVDEATQDWIKGDPLTFTSAKQRLLLVTEPGLSNLSSAVEQAQGEVVLINDASRPNFRELSQTVLKRVDSKAGCAPYLELGMLGTPVQLSDEQGAKPAADNIFGPAKTETVRTVQAGVELPHMALLQTPQAFPRKALLETLKAQAAKLAGCKPGSYAALYLAGGGELTVVPGQAGNINLVDEDSQRLLLKLMGGPARKQKDRYGGLGW